MPPAIEICVTYSGDIFIRNIGASTRYFDEFGDLDDVPNIYAVTPKTKDRIDGRDSMI